MALSWPSLILLAFSFSARVNAASKSNYTLTPELTSFIPSCAQECFISFLDANFPIGTCSAKPNLECLCSKNGTSGYTIGEGAVQCVISEINIGFCKGNSAKYTVVNGAYGMCSGQPSALPNTHATITATLILQTSMPSVVLVAPAPTKSSISRQSSSAVASTTSQALSSTFATITSRPSSVTTITSTASSVPAASDTASPEPVLSKKAIVGITVASIGGSAVAVGLLILFICCRGRKKTKKERESELIPFQLQSDHVMDQKKYKYKSFKGSTERRPGGTRNGVAARIAPKVPPRLDTSSPNMFSRRSIKPDTIGLAISPDHPFSTEKQQRRSSKLLPEKPTLTLKVPKQAQKPINGFSINQPNVHPSAVSRQSTATQFEEDYDESSNTMVAADDTWAAKSTDQILDVRTGTWQTIRKVDSEPKHHGSSNEVYHWQPQLTKNRPINPDYYIKPLSVVGRKVGSFSQPRKPTGYTRQYEQQQLSVPEQSRPITGSSSLYSATGSLSSNDAGRNNNTNPRTDRFSYQQTGPYDNQDSIVSPQEPRTAGTDFPLSPVVESPASGRSPVSYPKIPPPGAGAGATKRISQSTIRMVPPPPQPDFTKALGAGKPWRQAEIAAQIERERAAQGNGQVQLQILGQGQQGMPAFRIQSPESQQQTRPQETLAPASPVSYAFLVPPPQALIPGRSQTTSPPSLASPYLFRSPSQAKLVPPPLLRSHLQLQRAARTPPPSQNQGGGYIGQHNQRQIVTESPPTIKMTPPTELLRTRSQLQKEGRMPSPNMNQTQKQSLNQTRAQRHTQTLRIVTRSPPPPPPPQQQQPPISQIPTRPGPIPTQPSSYTTQHSQTQSSTTLPYPPTFPPERTSSLASQASSITNISISNSTSSSLLTKRRGHEAASTLTLSKTEEDQKRQMGKWRVLKREEIELAKKEGWRPMLGRENGGNVNGYLSPRDGAYEFERTELPTTPGWVPRLTPTRRGDELFLNVQ
ncbi:uncharacterized protein RAG0_16516 [Rhynchosporium agropyri]|uniref:Extracellular membrane protein CFEM domain-containing protein n=1 Tax=Rhynchosporium agropyri TaxID=914238 RepID=A0A1E1LQQ5_9HELO|nr:uncharacterized protein RAG0_16516 [Rhynchosporium agropyri]